MLLIMPSVLNNKISYAKTFSEKHMLTCLVRLSIRHDLILGWDMSQQKLVQSRQSVCPNTARKDLFF